MENWTQLPALMKIEREAEKRRQKVKKNFIKQS
jgi:hypothetical protein